MLVCKLNLSRSLNLLGLDFAMVLLFYECGLALLVT